MTQQEPGSFVTTSTGFSGSTAAWLDLHFEASRPEYEAQLQAVGFQRGWRVLDAACGVGSYLPKLAELVGSSGALGALDLTAENVAIVERRVVEWRLPCSVDVGVGNLTAQPYPDNTFDGVWCANAAQYLSEAELCKALSEFCRVVRPGGLVAVKDTSGFEFSPLPPYLLSHLMEAVGDGFTTITFRTPLLRRWLERAGLEGVWQRRTAIERWAPYGEVERQVLGNAIAGFAQQARRQSIAEAERTEWERVSDPDSPAYVPNAPGGSFVWHNVLAVGSVAATFV